MHFNILKLNEKYYFIHVKEKRNQVKNLNLISIERKMSRCHIFLPPKEKSKKSFIHVDSPTVSFYRHLTPAAKPLPSTNQIKEEHFEPKVDYIARKFYTPTVFFKI